MNDENLVPTQVNVGARGGGAVACGTVTINVFNGQAANLALLAETLRVGARRLERDPATLKDVLEAMARFLDEIQIPKAALVHSDQAGVTS